MAVDTRSKRASAVGLLLGFVVLAPVLPDGTIALADRQHNTWSYSGIAGSAPSGLPANLLNTTVTSTMPARTVASTMPARTVTFIG